MKRLIQLTLVCALFAAVSCREEADEKEQTAQEKYQEELQQWQIRVEDEIEKRKLAESEKLTSISRTRTLEKVVILTGVGAFAFLLIGGAMGSKTRKDAENS